MGVGVLGTGFRVPERGFLRYLGEGLEYLGEGVRVPGRVGWEYVEGEMEVTKYFLPGHYACICKCVHCICR